ncbi:CDP-alcohol phosphatidyltransferase family protein [Microbulbifer sp.]|uniref:CDP-alcohol phosphatidyltransferase family protein n=1 Tax=Microbulbifer sp. TaxID=1908541 RepID=UPI003F335F15
MPRLAPTPPHHTSAPAPGYQQFTPWLLVAARFTLGPLSILMVNLDLPRWIWITQFLLAILSDIYDGKLARRWGTASAGLRRADSITDIFYAFSCLTCFWMAEPDTISNHAAGIAVVVALQLARMGIDWLRFGKLASYHAFSMKVFGLTLIPVGILLMGFSEVYWIMWLSLAMGAAAQAEAMAMSLILPRWTHDVKHIGIALSIRKQYFATPQNQL